MSRIGRQLALSLRNILRWLLFIILIVATGLTLLAFWGNRHWILELTTHFRVPYLVLQFITGLGLGLLVSRKWIVIACVLSLPNLWFILPYYSTTRVEAASGSVSQLKILHMNVLGTNRNFEAASRLIQQVEPDILVLEEYNEHWQNALQGSGALKAFRYQYVVPYGNDGLYSKLPLRSVQVEYMSPGKDPTTIARFTLNQEPVTLLMVHPRPPVKPDWSIRQKNHFAKWEKDFARYGENVLIVGDLNTSPWSPTFQQLLSATKLRDSQVGFGLQLSWPALTPKGKLVLPLIPLIPIDHVLVSERFVVLNRKLGPSIGSDHLPVIAELGLRPGKAQ